MKYVDLHAEELYRLPVDYYVYMNFVPLYLRLVIYITYMNSVGLHSKLVVRYKSCEPIIRNVLIGYTNSMGLCSDLFCVSVCVRACR